MRLYGAISKSKITDLLIVVDEAGSLVECSFLRDRAAAAIEEDFARRGDELSWSAEHCAVVTTQLEEYFAGKRTSFDVSLAPRGTEFQRRVWDHLCSIPYGETASYGAVARAIGNERAVRAVGRANGANPIAIVVPCHRVIGGDGSLTGYGGGMSLKEKLLALEQKQMTLL